MKHRFLILVLWILFLPRFAYPVYAQGQVLGIHLLSPSELPQASKLLETKDSVEHFVTVPFTYDDLNYKERWQNFLREAHDAHIKPFLRLTTRFENGAWVIPTRADIMRFADFLTALDWHDADLTIILFNEPNHAAEWGGKIDPVSYVSLADFAVDWFKTEPKTYIVLPAGIDLAATTGGQTLEAFAFWKTAFDANSDFLDKLDGWTSHSYPNPGFTADPWKTDKKSLRGYQHELEFLGHYTKKTLPVYITETGWNHDGLSDREVAYYYQVAYKNIWNNDPRIKAVTPFLLQGAPGAFAPFSFLDAAGNPTRAYEVYRNLLSNKP